MSRPSCATLLVLHLIFQLPKGSFLTALDTGSKNRNAQQSFQPGPVFFWRPEAESSLCTKITLLKLGRKS